MAAPTSARRRRAVPPRPRTRPRERPTVLFALVLAAAAGLAVGVDALTALRVLLAVGVSLVLLVRVEWAALAVVGTAVFADYLDVLSPWTTEWLAVVLLLAWLLRRCAGPLHDRARASVLVPAAAFAVVLVLALAAHPGGPAGLEAAGRYAGLLAVLLALADTAAGPLSVTRAVRVFVVSCSAAAACGLVTALVSDAHRVAGPLARPDDLAFFLVTALPLVGTLPARTPAPWAADPVRRPTPWLAWACFALLAVGLLGTQSRAGYVAAVVVLAGAAATRVLSPQHAGGVLVLAATGVAFVLAVLPHPVGDALGDPQRYAETGLTQRLDVWHAAAVVVAEQPVLGVGPGGFAPREGALLAADPTRAALDVAADGAPGTAYSTPLQVAVELGLLGAVALLALFVVPAVALMRRRRRDPVSAAVLVAMAGAGTVALLESEQGRLPLWLLAALASALAVQDRRRPAATTVHPSGQLAL